MLMVPVERAEEAKNDRQQSAGTKRMMEEFRRLVAALEEGWFVEEPVYLQPRWSEGGPRLYHFILRRDLDSAPRLLSVPEANDVARFVEGEGLSVVAGTGGSR